MERDFKGVWIPKEIWLDDRLTALEKVILAEIDSLDADEYGGCIASNEYLAEFCKCSANKVALAVSKLKDLGYIELVSFDGRTRKLKSRLKENQRQTLKKSKADFEKEKAINIEDKKEDNKKERKQTYDTILDEEHIEGKKREAVTEFIKMRKMIRKPMTDHALRLMLRELEKLSNLESEQIAILEQSIANSWQGVFPLRRNGNEPAKHKVYGQNQQKAVGKVAHKSEEYDEGFDENGNFIY